MSGDDDRPEARPAANDVSCASAEPLDDSQVIRAVQEYLAEMEAGRKPNRSEFLARHRDISDPLAECLAALEFVHTVGPRLDNPSGRKAEEPAASTGAIEPGTPLGDFRIIRELGRGGMGIVYEAEQLSLGRQIALKVLPFALTLDPRQLQRFKNEARAAAQLHHTHIVPVYSVGCERGVYFYAMQYIEGRPLASVIRELQQQAGLDADQPASGSASAVKESPGTSDLTGPYVANDPPPPAPAATTVQSAVAAVTERSMRTAVFFRTTAELGVQAAEALEHAHELGVIHRDIKPGNLLVDDRGHLWVTDFGLAQFRGDAALTMTGDLLGTLRYMSPEQALAKRGLVDHRTDIYSLGATLYEMLTLHPACDGHDRGELLTQIAFEEPPPPRHWNKAIPADLETIVMKAMAKQLEERYATASELADDLRRFLEQRPILARRPTLLERAAKWARRHKLAVVTAVALLLTAAAGLAISTALIAREQWKTQQAYELITAEQIRTQAAYEAEAVQRADADESFRQARTAVDFFTQVCEDDLRDRPELQDVRRKLLEAALTYYKAFIEQRRDDPTIQAELAESHHRVATILEQIGSKTEAQAFREQGQKIEERLIRAGRPPFPRGLPWDSLPGDFMPDPGPLGLLALKAVKEDLKLDDEQMKKIAQLAARRFSLHMQPRKPNSKDRSPQPESVAAQEKGLADILRPEQATRLKQIALQQRGPFALGDADMAETLGLTAEQKQSIRTILDDLRQSTRGSVGPGMHMDPRKRIEKLKSAGEQAVNVLTVEQKTKWKELTGELLMLEIGPDMGGPFGPGREFSRPGKPSGSVP